MPKDHILCLNRKDRIVDNGVGMECAIHATMPKLKTSIGDKRAGFIFAQPECETWDKFSVMHRDIIA